MVVAIDGTYLYDYGGGIWDGGEDNKTCNANGVNHAVTIVGYGFNAQTNQSYWIIK